MWRFFDTKVLFVPDGTDIFEWIPFPIDAWISQGEMLSMPRPQIPWEGYDNWVQHFVSEDETALVLEVIWEAEKNPAYHAHIRGISLAESAELLREYYRKCGYEDALAKDYTLPNTVQITASISLRHALWCEKDKKFLQTLDMHGNPYGMTTPPLRWSHDLRILQQALRMNIIMGIEVFPGDEKYINMLVEQEIITPYSVSQMIQFRWGKYGYKK